ncbi:MAG: ankyrin repeat domain-containing protein [Alphaproteobacteria bacterium]|nr:MAG: ankyrin repeat domain-containing protein [Alphaproteobacteria bacterium]
MSLFSKFRKAAKPDELCGAIMRGETDLAKKLLQNDRIELDGLYGGCTALMWAAGGYGAVRPSPELVALLLEKGADVNKQGDGGETALGRASCVNATEVMKILIANKANLDQKDSSNDTALMSALMCRAEDAAILLMEKGAAIEGISKHGNWPGFSCLRFAVNSNLKKATERLLSLGRVGVPLEDVQGWAHNNEMKELLGWHAKERVDPAMSLREKMPARKPLKLRL